MKNIQGQWYIRKKGEVTGPFNASVIRNHLLLGRLSMNDEVSTDGQHWTLLAEQTSLHPTSVDPGKMRRYLDERTGLDRRNKQSSLHKDRRRQGERRAPEPQEAKSRRAMHRYLMQKFYQRQEKKFWPLYNTLILLLVLFSLAMLFPKTIPAPLPNCSAPPGPGINWDNCLKPGISLVGADLSGASLRNSRLSNADLMNALLADADMAYADLHLVNLSYSDLRNVSLLGSNLIGADLSYTDLTDADLSYANLNNARLGGAELKGARLDKAIWIDGRVCAKGSVGQCLLSVEQSP